MTDEMLVQRLRTGADFHESEGDIGLPCIMRQAADRLSSLEEEKRVLLRAEHRAVMANVRLGRWLSAALDDQSVCEEMKADIREWFSAGPPPHALSAGVGPLHTPMMENR